MGLFEPVSLLRKRLCSTCPAESSSPPQEKPSTTYPKTPPHQDFSSPVCGPRDRSHDQPPSTNQLRSPRRRFVTGTNKRSCVSVIKNTPLQALLPPHGHDRDVSPNQRSRDACPDNGAESSKVIYFFLPIMR